MLTEKSAGSDVAGVKFRQDAPTDVPSLASALDVLKGAIDKCQDNSTSDLTENDYEQLVVLLGELMDIVRDNETHLLAPLMEFVFVLIENYEHKYIPELTEDIENHRVQYVLRAKKELVVG